MDCHIRALSFRENFYCFFPLCYECVHGPNVSMNFPWIIVVTCVLCSYVEGSYDSSDKMPFPNLPNAAPRSENTICREESQLYIEHLNNMTLWAHKSKQAREIKKYLLVLITCIQISVGCHSKILRRRPAGGQLPVW